MMALVSANGGDFPYLFLDSSLVVQSLHELSPCLILMFIRCFGDLVVHLL